MEAEGSELLESIISGPKPRVIRVSPQAYDAIVRSAILQGKDPQTVLNEALVKAVTSVNYQNLTGEHIVSTLGIMRLMIQSMKELAEVMTAIEAERVRTTVTEQARAMKELQRELIDTTIIADTISRYIKERMPEIEARLSQAVSTSGESTTSTGSTSGGILGSLISNILADIVAGLRDDIIRYLQERGYKETLARTIADIAELSFRTYAQEQAGGGRR